MKRFVGLITTAFVTIATAAAALATANISAQSYPARQILMVVPLQAGTCVGPLAQAALALWARLPHHVGRQFLLLR